MNILKTSLIILLLLSTLILATFLSLAFQGISPRLLLGSIFGIILPEMIEERGVAVSVTVLEIPKLIFLQDLASPYIFNILIHSLTSHSVTIDWQTNEASTSQIDYGLTENYELGTIQDEPPSLKTIHSLTLRGLTSETTYHFRIRSRDAAGNERVSQDFTVTTLSEPDTTPPANVASFKAEGRDKAIYLSWINPKDPDFAGVIIKRSEELYPIFPDQGLLVYQGKEESFLDEGLINDERYYYVAFAYDHWGNYSSGALASAIPQARRVPFIKEVPEEILPEEIPFEIIPLVISEPLPITSPALEAIPFLSQGERLVLEEDFIFSTAREKIKLKPIKGKINILPGINLEISIPKKRFPRAPKLIWLDFEGKYYLLKESSQQDSYQTVIIAPQKPGRYSLDLVVIYEF
jgi:hypothetical protein